MWSLFLGVAAWLCVGQYCLISAGACIRDTPSLLNFFLKNLYGQILANTFKITTRMDKRKVHFKKFFLITFLSAIHMFHKVASGKLLQLVIHLGYRRFVAI